ncbi:MAG TPA: hypothetical protein DIC31_09115, partial [Rhizobiales bacterium]|nr:hypothetical protein [Hyphomicrobiales bacterium]
VFFGFILRPARFFGLARPFASEVTAMGLVSNIGASPFPYHGTERLRRQSMDEQRFNMSMRKYLKEVGVTSQQEI